MTTVLVAVLVGLAGAGSAALFADAALAAPGSAAEPAVSDDHVSYDAVTGVLGTVDPDPVAATVGDSLIFANDSSDEIVVSDDGTWGSAGFDPITIGAGDVSGEVAVPSAAGSYGFSVTDEGVLLSVPGTVTVTDAQSSPPPSTSSSDPVTTSSTPASTSSAPGGGSSASGAPGTGRSSSTAPAAGTATTSSPFGGIGLPGGLIPFAGLGGTAPGSVQDPLVAPFAPLRNGQPPTPAATPSPTPTSSVDGEVLADASVPSPATSRDLGLPAAVTAVLLAGLIAALVRVLLANPTAQGPARKH